MIIFKNAYYTKKNRFTLKQYHNKLLDTSNKNSHLITDLQWIKVKKFIFSLS